MIVLHSLKEDILFQILVDQGEADSFLDEGLRPWLLSEVCEKTSINLELRMHPNYDHSYYFISTFMADHLNWHRIEFKKDFNFLELNKLMRHALLV